MLRVGLFFDGSAFPADSISIRYYSLEYTRKICVCLQNKQTMEASVDALPSSPSDNIRKLSTKWQIDSPWCSRKAHEPEIMFQTAKSLTKRFMLPRKYLNIKVGEVLVINVNRDGCDCNKGRFYNYLRIVLFISSQHCHDGKNAFAISIAIHCFSLLYFEYWNKSQKSKFCAASFIFKKRFSLKIDFASI